jgi:hypothetical protein
MIFQLGDRLFLLKMWCDWNTLIFNSGVSMNYLSRIGFSVLLTIICVTADEGMWLPHQIKQLEWDKKD